MDEKRLREIYGPAKEKAASGYEHSQFVADDDDQMPSSNW